MKNFEHEKMVALLPKAKEICEPANIELANRKFFNGFITFEDVIEAAGLVATEPNLFEAVKRTLECQNIITIRFMGDFAF